MHIESRCYCLLVQYLFFQGFLTSPPIGGEVRNDIPRFYSIFCTPIVMKTKSNNFKWRFLANARNDSALFGLMGVRRERLYRRSRLTPIPKKTKVVIPNPEESG